MGSGRIERGGEGWRCLFQGVTGLVSRGAPFLVMSPVTFGLDSRGVWDDEGYERRLAVSLQHLSYTTCLTIPESESSLMKVPSLDPDRFD